MTRTALFVDDEPRVLDGLRRGLRELRHDWQLRFALGGQEAVAALDESVTVVVSDMRMPGLDGADVLEAARERAPGAARVILSGNSDRGAAVRAVGLAHRFLAKPCEAAALKALLPVLAGLVETGPDLAAFRAPACSSARREVLDGLLRDGASTAEVVAVVEQEPGLVLLLLHAASSSFFLPASRCDDLDAAVEHLGPMVVRDLLEGRLAAAAAPRLLPPTEPGGTGPDTSAALAGLAPLLPVGTLPALLELWGLAPGLTARVADLLDAAAVPT